VNELHRAKPKPGSKRRYRDFFFADFFFAFLDPPAFLAAFFFLATVRPPYKGSRRGLSVCRPEVERPTTPRHQNKKTISLPRGRKALGIDALRHRDMLLTE
jgi:hypothetical protein